MTKIAAILSPGVETTLQDSGRPGLRHLGVPLSGAADRVSLALANAALGNPWDAPALECAGAGPELQFTSGWRFALGGADMNATLNDTPLDLYAVYSAAPDDILKLGAPKQGARAYIAFVGGLAGANHFNSTSTYAPAGLGGVNGRALIAGDVLAGANISPGHPVHFREAAPNFSGDIVLRVVHGPEAGLFDPRQLRVFHSRAYAAGRRGNRMGLELSGAPMAPADDFSMISSPVFPGTVQCPPAGNPFLLLVDAQTVGGYARIAQVIDADLPLAGQIRPGDQVWFMEVSADQARAINASRAAYISAYIPGFRFA